MLKASGLIPQTLGRGGALTAFWLGALGCLQAACIVGENKCDAHQVEAKDNKFYHYCTCEPNAIPSAAGFGCTPCGANEIVVAGACACAPGFAKLSATDACTEVVVGQVAIHQACASDTDCGGAYPYCASAGSSGYCTAKGCTSHADCTEESYYCDDAGATKFCHEPPTGVGMTCVSDADCAGKAASHCETQQSHTCIITGCGTDPGKCKAQACCDLTSLGAGSLCVPQSSLKGGKCFDGSDPVKP